MNKIILVGRLTKDPDIRNTSSGVSVTTFTIAVNRPFKNKEGNYDADFLQCVSYRATADFIGKFFKKGNMICVEGRVQTRNYDAQDGTKRYVTEVVVENAEFTGGKNETGNKTDNGYYPDVNDFPNEVDLSSNDPFENYGDEISVSESDLPF